MTLCYFDTDDARAINTNAAIIYQFIKNACKKNATQYTHYANGKYWVALPQRVFEEVFPTMCARTVYSNLKILEALEYIESNCFDTYTKVIKSYSPL